MCIALQLCVAVMRERERGNLYHTSLHLLTCTHTQALNLSKGPNLASMSQPYRTKHSSYLPATSPTVNHISSYAYVASLSSSSNSTPHTSRERNTSSSSQSPSPLLRHSPNPASAASGHFTFDSFPKTEPVSVATIQTHSPSTRKPQSRAMSADDSVTHGNQSASSSGESSGDPVSTEKDIPTSQAPTLSSETVALPVTTMVITPTSPSEGQDILSAFDAWQEIGSRGIPSSNSSTPQLTRAGDKSKSSSSGSDSSPGLVLKPRPIATRTSPKPGQKRTVNVVSTAGGARGSRGNGGSPRSQDHTHSPAEAKLRPVATRGQTTSSTSTQLPSANPDIQEAFNSWEHIGARFANPDSSGPSSQSSSGQSTPRIKRSNIATRSPASSPGLKPKSGAHWRQSPTQTVTTGINSSSTSATASPTPARSPRIAVRRNKNASGAIKASTSPSVPHKMTSQPPIAKDPSLSQLHPSTASTPPAAQPQKSSSNPPEHCPHTDSSPGSTRTVFRHDLSDSLSQEADIVTFGHRELMSDSDSEDRGSSTTGSVSLTDKHSLTSSLSDSSGSVGRKINMTVVPAAAEKLKATEKKKSGTETKGGTSEQKPGKKEGRRLSSLLSSGRTTKSSSKPVGESKDSKREDSTKAVRRLKKPGKKEAGSDLKRENSLPMTATRNQPPTTSPLSSSGSDKVSPNPPKERSFFRRWSFTKRSGDKPVSSLQKTGWKYSKDDHKQLNPTTGLFPAKSEMFLDVIGEDEKPEAEAELSVAMRTQSMSCLYEAGNVMTSSLSQEADLPVTIVQTRSPVDIPSGEIDVTIPDLHDDDKTPPGLERDDIFQSPVSMSSITLDIPGLNLDADSPLPPADSPKPMSKYRPASVPVGQIHLPPDSKKEEKENEKIVEDLERERMTKSMEPGRKIHNDCSSSNDSLDRVDEPFKRFSTTRNPVRRPSTSTQNSPAPKLKKRSSSFAPHDCQSGVTGSSRPHSAGTPRLKPQRAGIFKSASKSSLTSHSSSSSSCFSTPNLSRKAPPSPRVTPGGTPLSSRRTAGTPSPQKTPTNSPKLHLMSRHGAVPVKRTGSFSPKKTTPTSSPKTSPLVKQKTNKRGPLSDRTGTPATTTVSLRSSGLSSPHLRKTAQQTPPPSPRTSGSRARKVPIAPITAATVTDQWEKTKFQPRRSLPIPTTPTSPSVNPKVLGEEESQHATVLHDLTSSSSMDLDARAMLAATALREFVDTFSNKDESSSEHSSPTKELTRNAPRSSGKKPARPAPPPPNKSPMPVKKAGGSPKGTGERQSTRATSSSTSKSSTPSPSHSFSKRKPPRPAPPPPSRSTVLSQKEQGREVDQSGQDGHSAPQAGEQVQQDQSGNVGISKQSGEAAVEQSSGVSDGAETPSLTTLLTDTAKSPNRTPSPLPSGSSQTSPSHRKPARPAPPPPKSASKKTDKAVKTSTFTIICQSSSTHRGPSPQQPIGRSSPSSSSSSPTPRGATNKVSPLAKRAFTAKQLQANKGAGKQNLAERRKARYEGTNKEGHPHSPIPSTMDLLNPVDSLLSLSMSDMELSATKSLGSLAKDKLEGDPLSPPPIATMPARPFSPCTPIDLEPMDTHVMAVTPGVPVWSDSLSQPLMNQGKEEEQLTYIYRSTLLRKSSRPNTSTLERKKMSVSKTSSGKQLNSLSDSRLPQLSRSSSKGRLSVVGLHSTSHQTSKKGFDRGSMRRPSSGIVRQGSDTCRSATLGRPRSASVFARQSLRKSSTATSSQTRSGLAESGLTKQQQTSSVKTKKVSAPASPQHKTVDQSNSPGSSPSRSKPPSGKPPKLSVTDHTSTQALSQSSPQSSLTHSIKATMDIRRSSAGNVFPTKQRVKSATTRNTMERTSSGLRSSIMGPLITKTISTSDTSKLRASMRLSRTSSGSVRKMSQAANPYGTLTKRPTPPPSVPSSKHNSPSHRLSRASSVERDEIFSAFDHVSALADKSA